MSAAARLQARGWSQSSQSPVPDSSVFIILPSLFPPPILLPLTNSFLPFLFFFPFSYVSRWIFKVRVCKSASHSYMVKSHSFTRRVVLGAQQPPPLHLQLPRGCRFLISELHTSK